ncbi:MAG TPA: VWA domain-containing protein, partial [Ktedonobacterales bacterium]|nr:VWA domain-containing protein [Ktedonobacterales bacterium]
MFNRFRSRKSFRYSRWDGTQRLDDLDAEDILDALSDDYLKHGDLRRALDRLTQQGFQDRNGTQRMGMQDLLNRLRQRRQQQMQRYNMSGVMDDIQQKLEHIKELEREGIQRRLDGQQPGEQRRSAPSDGERQAPGEQDEAR